MAAPTSIPALERLRFSEVPSTERSYGMKPHRSLALMVLAAFALTFLDGRPGLAAPPEALQIVVLSNRADLISGGDALVEIVLPGGVSPSSVRVTVDGLDVTGAFAVRPNGRF